MSNQESAVQDSGSEASEFSPVELYLAVRERWWVIAACLAVTCGLALIYIIRTPKTYAAETIVQVEDSERKIVNIQDVSNDDLRATEQLKTIEQNLSSLVVLQGVIDALKLTPAQLGLPPRQDPPYSPMEMMRKLSDLTTVKLQRGTRLISVTLENTDPALAQKLSSQTIKQFIGAYMEQRVGISDDAYSFLTDERDRLKNQVVQSEKAVQDFKDTHPGLPLDDSQNLTDSRLLTLNTALNDARNARFKLEADFAQVNEIGYSNPDDLLRISSVANAAAVLAMQKDFAAAESDFAAITERYKEKHPKYIQAQRKLEQLRSAMKQTIVKAGQGVGASLTSARETEQKAETLLKNVEQAKLDFTKVSLPYAVLVKDLENDRDLYNSVQRRLKETEITRSMDQGSVHVVQPAYLPDKPSKPKKLLVAIAAVMSGFLIGGLLVFALHAVDQSFRTVDQVEQALGLPAVGSIPKIARRDLAAKALLTVQDPDNPVSEAFRSLRAALSLLDQKKNYRSVLFTSAVPGEGKSFCSVNYAVALAQLGERTLIIDGDLRLPTVHTLFFDKAPENGVGNILLGKTSFDAAVLPTPVENLFVLPAGGHVQKPAELIARGVFSRVLKEALAKFDRVIIDSAPIHAVSDSLLMLKDVGHVCLVVQAMKTQRRMVNRALQKITEAEGNISGIILNQLPKSAAGYYYYYSPGKYGETVYGAPNPDRA